MLEIITENIDKTNNPNTTALLDDTTTVAISKSFDSKKRLPTIPNAVPIKAIILISNIISQ